MSSQKFDVILNGVVLGPEDYSGTADSKIVIRQKDKDGLVFSYSNDIQLLNNGRQTIFDNILDDANPYTASVPLVLRDLCCKDDNGQPFTMYEGLVRSADLKWCEKDVNDATGCTTLEVTSEDNSIEAQGIRCLKNTPIVSRESLDGSVTSNGEDEFREAVYFRYCIETRPRVMQALRLAFISLNLTLLAPVFGLIVILVAIFTFGSAVPDIVEFNKKWTLNLIGCDRKHKAPFVHSYLRNVCKLCNLTLESSLFEYGGPYYDLTHFSAPFEKGRAKIDRADEVFRTINFPSDTGTQFLDTFRNLNIDYSVEGSKLIVERKDYFTNNIWIDFSVRNNDIISQCYEFGSEGPKAGRVYEYQKDAGDIGEEANRLWGGQVVNYNIPYNPVLKGVDKVIVPFAPARFSDDTFGSLIGTIIIPTIKIPKHVLLLSRGTTTAPKLLMFDTGSDKEDARVKKESSASPTLYFYNLDAWMRDDIDLILPSAGQDNFYTRLLYIDDPREATDPSVEKKHQKYTLVFSYTCDDIRSFKVGSRIKLVQRGQVVVGTIDTLEIDFQKRQMTINGNL